MNSPDLSIIIPTLNEQDLILDTLHAIGSNLGSELSKKTQIIIVDDGIDDLPEVINSYSNPHFNKISVMRNERRLGKGKSVSNGFQAAEGSIIGFIDADLSISPVHIANAYSLLRASENYGLIGERKNSRIERLNPMGAFLSAAFSMVMNTVFFDEQKFPDTQCGFKFFKGNIGKELYTDLVAHDGLADAEVLIKAHKRGYKIVRYEVDAKNSRKTKRPLRKILVKEISSLCRILTKHF